MGSGKSEVGRLLARKLSFESVDIDFIIEQKEGKAIVSIFKDKGEGYFRKLESDVIYGMKNIKNKVISYGGGAILNEDNRRIIKEDSIVIWLYVSPDEALKRIKAGSRPLLNEIDANRKAESILNERLHLYAQTSDIVVDTDNKNTETLVEEIYEEISKTCKII